MLFPCLQLCDLVSFQRYTKELPPTQRASLLDKSRQQPKECIQALTNVRSLAIFMSFLVLSCCNLTMHLIRQAVRNCRFDSDPLLAACGISIEKQLTQVDGRVLEAPRVKFEFVLKDVSYTKSIINCILILLQVGFPNQNLSYDFLLLEFIFILQLKFGKGEDCIPQNGRWNYYNKVFPWFPSNKGRENLSTIGVGKT